MGTTASNPARADVVIITALREERDALLEVTTGALGSWVSGPLGTTALTVDRRSFRAADGGELHVAAVCAENQMGGEFAAAVASPAVTLLRPRCLAMCGVLAGRRGDAALGDVVFADQLLTHDTGKRTENGFEHGFRPHTLPLDWLRLANDFAEDPGDALAWLDRAPWTVEQQRGWLLDSFSRGLDPMKQRELVQECCPEYDSIVRELMAAGYVRAAHPHLTEKGVQHVEEQRFLQLAWPGLDHPRRRTAVRVGNIVSGNAVQADKAIWTEMAQFARKALGLEMEAHAAGTVAEVHQVDLAVVMKGVMDHADPKKDDRFKTFAARASGECLLAFLRRYVASHVRAGTDDLLAPGTLESIPDPATAAPSVLLTAQHVVVEWHDELRADSLRDLDRWVNDTSPVVSVHLLHADGGVGKTRLAIEWVQRRRASGDLAGFLAPRLHSSWLERLLECGRPVIVVVDYAESRPDLLDLLERIAAYAASTGNRVRLRLLLLARNAGDWWNALGSRSTTLRALVDGASATELRAVPVVGALREQIFLAAATRLAELRGRTAPKQAPPLADERFGRVLYLHMAALASVENLTPTADTLMEETLRHEESFWQRHANERLRATIDVALARQLLAAATLRGGFRTQEVAIDQLSQLIGRSLSEREETLVAALRQVYGRADGAFYIPSLEPDLLGEALIIRVASAATDTGWIDRVFPPSAGEHEVTVAFTTLDRASLVDADAVRPWVEGLLDRSLTVRAPAALVAARLAGEKTAFSVLGKALAAALRAHGGTDVAKKLDEIEVPQDTVSLREVGVWVDRRLLQDLEGEETTLAERARRANNLCIRLMETGQHREALVFTREATSIYRQLAAENPGEFRSRLARSLNTTGAALRNIVESEEGLAVSLEAVEILEQMASVDPAAHTGSLAGAMNNLAIRYSDLSRHEEARDMVSRATKLYRSAVQVDPVFLPDLASSLNNLGAMLGEVGDLSAALAALHEAVYLRQLLVDAHPDAYLPSLADSLHNLGGLLAELGRHGEAAIPMMQCLLLYFQLFERHPEVFRVHASGALEKLVEIYAAMGDPAPDFAEGLSQVLQASTGRTRSA